ncbi:putative ABC transporter ATP-binding component [Parascardovia denticolens DSM 10105 = JCM 12538]|nr:putative ABC transporter ATP-binding component [Parascardovia denticolens DSM 10105 = JCM 12538]
MAYMKRMRTVLSSCAWCVRVAFKSSWRFVLPALILGLVASLVPSLQTVSVGKLTEALSLPGRPRALTWSVITGVLVAGYLGLRNVVSDLWRMTQNPMVEWCRNSINEALSRRRPDEIGSQEEGDLARQAREAVNSGSITLQVAAINAVFTSVIVCLSLMVTIWRASWVAAILVLLCLFPSVIGTMVYAEFDQRTWPKVMRSRRYGEYLENQLTYERPAVELATLGAQGFVARKARPCYRRQRELSQGIERVGLESDLVAGVVSGALLILAIISLLYEGASPSLIAGSVVGVLSGMQATASVAYELGNMVQASISISSLQKLVAEKPPIPRIATKGQGVAELSSGVLLTPEADFELDLSGLSFTYPQADASAVHDVSLKAKKGEFIAFVGRNGAGKTTLLKCLSGAVKPQAGSMIFKSGQSRGKPISQTIDLSQLSPKKKSEIMSFMVQDYNHFEFTVRENLSLGRGRADSGGNRTDRERLLWDSLESVGEADLVRSLPDGLDTQLGAQWDGADLSGGQWQRLAIARSLVQDAPVRVFDEPTSNVDSAAEEEIIHELKKRGKDKLTILVTHRAWTLKAADMIYIFDSGTIVDCGTYDELVQHSPVFNSLFNYQLKGGDSND